MHQPILQIEQYANQQEWVEGTLIEDLTEEERLKKEMKEYEKRINLDYFAQVPFTQPQHIGVSTSDTTTSQQSAQEATPPVGKGK